MTCHIYGTVYCEFDRLRLSIGGLFYENKKLILTIILLMKRLKIKYCIEDVKRYKLYKHKHREHSVK